MEEGAGGGGRGREGWMLGKSLGKEDRETHTQMGDRGSSVLYVGLKPVTFRLVL